jgi:hypothetical protein
LIEFWINKIKHFFNIQRCQIKGIYIQQIDETFLKDLFND